MEECLKLLIDAGGDVNARTEKNKTPLYFAVEEDDLRLAELLLKYGGDPNACSEYGSLLHSVGSGRPECVELLIQNGANVNAKDKMGATPLLRPMCSASSHRSYHSMLETGEETTILKYLRHGASKSLLLAIIFVLSHLS